MIPDYLTFFICCKLQAEASESPNFYLLKDLSINNEKNIENIIFSLNFLTNESIIYTPQFNLIRRYDQNLVTNMIIETAMDPLELSKFNLVDYVQCGYILKIKNKELLSKLISDYVERFKNDDLTTSTDSSSIQRGKVETLINRKYKQHRKKKLELNLRALENVDLLSVLQSLRLEDKINIMNYKNHRRYWHDDMGHDDLNPAIGVLVQASRQGKRYDLDIIEVEFEISNEWYTEIMKKIFFENFVMELKYFDGRIWIEVGDKKVHIAKMHSFGNNDELLKFVTNKQPGVLVEIKSETLDSSEPQVDPIKKLLKGKDLKKWLSNIGFDATIRTPFFYDIGKESLKFNGFKITGKRMQEMGIDPEEYLKALEKVQPTEESDEGSNLASLKAKK